MHPSFAAIVTSRKYNQPTWVTPLLLTLKLLEKDQEKNGENKSLGPYGVPGKTLKLGGVTMTPYLARLLEISFKNATIPSDWK